MCNYNYIPLKEPVRITEQNWIEGTLPIVSIGNLTYNHEAYIRDCIEGFLMQKTTFPVHIYIFEDCSTDRTAEILKEYQAKYPQLFTLFCQPENTYGKPTRKAAVAKYHQARNKGKYTALCDGDDYWTDPLKLQKQADFLEANGEYVICAHNSVVKNESLQECSLFNSKILENNFSFEDIIKTDWFIPTASIVFRSSELERCKFSESFYNGDYYLQLRLLSNNKKLNYTNEIMSVYRNHPEGISKSISFTDVMYKIIELLQYMDDYTNKLHTSAFQERITRLQNRISDIQQQNKRQKTLWYRLRYKIIYIMAKILRVSFR